MSSKKVGCITFHASHNYGSNLQAYALQKFISNISDYKYEIINYRSDKQKEYYKLYFEKKGIKNLIKSILFWKYRKQIRIKFNKYEEFINNRLNITDEYNNVEQLNSVADKYDYYISGSDQIWNLIPLDFDWCFYLDFVKKGKKISYSASFGPTKQEWNQLEMEKVKNNLQKYDFISVREEGSANNVYKLIAKKPQIHIDPTLLIDKEQWNEIVSNNPIIKGNYIFLYDLKLNSETYRLVNKISKELNMPVVTTQDNKCTIFTNYIKCYDAGPEDFLNLIKNSKLVLSSSFHGNVFSIIFNKPFFAINGTTDFRIHTLMQNLKLTDREIDINNYLDKLNIAFEVNYSETNEIIKSKQNDAKKYLMEALDIKRKVNHE